MTLAPADAAFEGFRIIRDRPGLILAWTGFYLASLLVMIVTLLLPNLGGLAAVAPGGGERDFDQLLARFGPAILIVIPMALVMMTVLITGIFRAVLRPEDRGWAHLKVSGDELRVFVISVIVFLIFGLASAAFGLAVVTLGNSVPALRGLLAFVGSAGGLALIVWLAVRFSLSGAQSFAERKIRLVEDWRLTQGHFWRLVSTLVLAAAFAIIVFVVSLAVSALLAGMLGGFQLLGELVHPDPAVMTPTFAWAILAQLLLQLAIQSLVIVMVLVILYAAPAAAYRTLSAREP